MPKQHATLIKPPKAPAHLSPIETALSLLRLDDIGPDLFTNQRPLWRPAGARGVFGGAVIAQCLSAAQATIPPEFTVHSLHCYFVLPGDASIPIIYHVERVRDGRSFITRTVQARQQGRPIFTTTLSFMREDSGGRIKAEHSVPMPTHTPPPPAVSCHLFTQRSPFDQDKQLKGEGEGDDDEEEEVREAAVQSPFDQVRLPMTEPRDPHVYRAYAWNRARGRISDSPPGHSTTSGDSDSSAANTDPGNHQAHLSAVAYMSDSYFIGTVARVHGILPIAGHRNTERILAGFAGTEAERCEMRAYLDGLAAGYELERRVTRAVGDSNDGRNLGMMVSLDHTIYFHNPRSFRADEWMLAEVETPWAGDGRGLVMQRIWSKDGILIATCIQEGLVRLKQDGGQEQKKPKQSKI